MNRKKNLVLFFILGSFIVFFLTNSSPVHQYISVMKAESAKVSSMDDDSLRKQIEEWKRKNDQAPINAYVDRIWKAVPGYNGRIVEINASLENMRSKGITTEEGLVYREIQPDKSLEELGTQPTYRGNPKKPAVSFMVNVAWGNEYLEKILATLKKHQVKTTFFLDGSWVKRYPELARKIKDEGHEIANHAYSHPDMSRLGTTRIREEIGKTQKVIEQTLGVKPTLFAPPSGSFNDSVVSIALREFQMRTILWTADTIDWQKPPVNQMIERVEKRLGNGVLVLMHPTAPSAAGLDQLLTIAKKRGLTVTTVSEVISSKRLSP